MPQRGHTGTVTGAHGFKRHLQGGSFKGAGAGDGLTFVLGQGKNFVVRT